MMIILITEILIRFIKNFTDIFTDQFGLSQYQYFADIQFHGLILITKTSKLNGIIVILISFYPFNLYFN